MKNNTRIAKVTFDIVFLLLLLLPILAFLLTCMNEGMIEFSRDFNGFVSNNFQYSTQVENVINQVLGHFDNVDGNVPCSAYLAYIVSVTIAFVVVHILCFIPKLCIKLMKGWI